MSLKQPGIEGSSLAAGGNESNMTRNITRACDMCRRKKIKCDWRTPACGHCMRCKTACVYTPTQRSKRPSKKSAKSSDDLERRLARMESALGLRASSAQGNYSNYALTVSDNIVPGQGSTTQSHGLVQSTSISNSSPKLPVHRPITDFSLPQTTTDYNDTSNIGFTAESSTSMTALEIAPDIHGELAKFQSQTDIETASIANPTTPKQPCCCGYPLDPTTTVPLPPLNEALPLIHLYFASFNQVFPLFHEPSFMDLISERYLANGIEDPAWWGSINIVLSQGYSLRAMGPNRGPDDKQKSMIYLRNASIVGPQIMLWGTDLLSLQALLGMAILVYGTPTPGCYPILVTGAVRLGYMIGLHRQQEYDPTLTAIEIAQRKRVFWITYVLDKDLSLRSEIPIIQNDDDINVELPTQDIRGRILFLLSGRVETVDFFSLRVQLSIIQGMICKQLYSAIASYQSPGQREDAIQGLDRVLKEWRESIPLDFSPESSKSALDGLSVVHIIALHSTYFYSLMKLHHNPLQGISSQTGPKAMESFNPRLFAPEPSCILVARELMDLIKVAPQGGYACIWLILYPSVSALITLLHNALHHPDDIHARFDLQRVDPLVSILASLAEMEGNREVVRMHVFCVELKRRALAAVTKYETDMDKHQTGNQKDNIENSRRLPVDSMPHKSALTL